MTKNITLAIDEDVIDRVRKIAVDRKTTVNGLVREYLTRLADTEDRAQKAREELLRMSEKTTWIPATDDGRGWTREDLYDRDVLRRHERDGVRGVGGTKGQGKKTAGS